MLVTSRQNLTMNENKTMDFLAVMIVLLFTALLFVTFGFPILRNSLGVSQSIVNNPTSIESQ